MTTTVAADHDIKALRQRAARLGCRLLKRRGSYWLLDKDDDSGIGIDSLEDAANEIGRRERGNPITISTACGMPLYTHDPKTGQIIDHQTERALADLSTAIRAAHEQAERTLRDGLLHAIRAGELLLLAKQQVEHGEWENWLQANVPFQARTARAYMQLARLDPEKRQRVADLPLREALSAIRSREQKIADAEARENRPPPGPARFATVANGSVLYGEDAIDHINSLPAPPKLPPATPEEIADILIRQLVECAYQEKLTDADIVAAFERRFGERQERDKN